MTTERTCTAATANVYTERPAWSFQVWVPTLADSWLDANKIGKGKTHEGTRHKINEARQDLRTSTVRAVQSRYAPADIPVAPEGWSVLITFIYVHTHKAEPLAQGYYRPIDPSNAAGNVAKGPVDALMDLGIIPDDKSESVSGGTVKSPGVVWGFLSKVARAKTRHDEGFLLSVTLVERLHDREFFDPADYT